MKIYNVETGKIEVLPKIINNEGINIYTSKISDERLEELGFLKLEYQSKPNKRYYNSTENREIVGKKFIISYSQEEKPLEEVKALMIKEVYESKKKSTDSLVEKYPYGEVAIFTQQYKEVKDFKESGIIGDFMQARIDSCGCSPDNYSDMIIENSLKFINVETSLQVERDNKKAEIKALSTLEEIIEYETPEVIEELLEDIV